MSEFQPFVTNYITIEQITVFPSRNVKRSNYRYPDTILSQHPRFVIRSRGAAIQGKATNLPKLHYLGALLLRNEVLGCIQQAMDTESLLRNFRREFPKSSARQSRKYFDRISTYRSNYNKGKLYRTQNLPPLYSFPWNSSGYIRHPSKPSILIGFEFCKRRLIKEKFIDPRFFNEQEREEYRKDETFHVPLLIEIQRIEAEIKKPIYNSIEFPSGYGKGYTTV